MKRLLVLLTSVLFFIPTVKADVMPSPGDIGETNEISIYIFFTVIIIAIIATIVIVSKNKKGK